MKTTVTRATLADASRLEMRAEDEAECLAFGYATGHDALEAGIRNSIEAWSIFFDGELGVVLGVELLADRSVYIWCLTGKVVDRAHLAFWRVSKAIVLQARITYGNLFALADQRYVRALEWLKRLGFMWVGTRTLKNGLGFNVMHAGGL